jgi:hypothetical protein
VAYMDESPRWDEPLSLSRLLYRFSDWAAPPCDSITLPQAPPNQQNPPFQTILG